MPTGTLIIVFVKLLELRLINLPKMVFNYLYILFHCRIRPDTDRFTFCNGVVWERAQVLASFGNDWLNGIIDFSKSLHALGLDLTSFVCLCGLTLVTGMILAMAQLKSLNGYIDKLT